MGLTFLPHYLRATIPPSGFSFKYAFEVPQDGWCVCVWQVQFGVDRWQAREGSGSSLLKMAFQVKGWGGGAAAM